jgi:D-alanine transaminase
MIFTGYYNGEIGPLEDMKIPMLDRVVFFGDACYDMATFRNRRAFALRDHLNRFYRSCSQLDIHPELGPEELAAEIQKLIDFSDSDRGSVYWQASRGTKLRSFAYGKDPMKANLIMYAGPAELEPEGKVYRLRSQEDTRFLHCNIKTTNLIPAVLYSQRALEEGCEESILHRNGYVTECAHSNVVILRNGELWVRPQDNLILPGVTMNILIMLANEIGVPVREQIFTLEELRSADEIIITSTGVPCVPGVSLDGKPVGGHDPMLLQKLRQAYMDFYNANTSREEILDEAHY